MAHSSRKLFNNFQPDDGNKKSGSPGGHAPINPEKREETVTGIELWIDLMADVVAGEIIQTFLGKEEPLDAQIHTIETH